MHPYEMYQTLVQRSEDRLVKVRPGSLYHTVDRLARHGLVRATGTEREGNRPERTTYEITEDGTLALGERVADIIAHPRQRVPRVPARPRRGAQPARRDRHRAAPQARRPHPGRHRRARRRRSEPCGRSHCPPKYWLDVRYQRAMAEADAATLEALIHDLESGALSWDEEKHGATRSQQEERDMERELKPWPALWALVIGFFMILIDTTIVSVANPSIMKGLDLGTDYNAVIWVTSAYLLAYAVPLLITGRLGDRFGPKNLYLIGLVVFTLASAWCGFSGQHRAADRRPCRPGPRRRADDAADDGRHHPHLPAGAPRCGHGPVGRGRRRRDPDRPDPRRRARRQPRLGVDLLHQRARGHRGVHPRGAPGPEAADAQPQLRHPRRDPVGGRHVPAGVRHPGGRHLRLGRHRGARSPSGA